jgi:LuxR family maltose regulon positive regulatory protein
LPLLSVASTVENFTIVHITLARIKAINERCSEAFQLLDYVHSVLESGCHQRFLAQVCREKMRLHLLQNNAARALGDLRRARPRAPRRSGNWQQVRPYDEEWERFGFAYTLLLLHRKRTDEARAILTVLRDSARAAGFVYREVALEAALPNANGMRATRKRRSRHSIVASH